MKRLKNKHLFRLFEYIQPYLSYSIPIEESIGSGSKVLVIAPHQDDEAIGCAGTVIKHTRTGGEAEILFCTKDTEERMKEAEAAIAIMGIRKAHYLQYGIRSLNGNAKFEQNLGNILRKVKPDVVFLPFWFDNHQDHRAVSMALINIKKKIRLNFMVYAYPVWSPLNPNCLVDISDVWEQKKMAIECYKTQTVSRNYVKIAKGLNSYWGEIKRPGMQYAEVFFKATIDEYVLLGKKIFK